MMKEKIITAMIAILVITMVCNTGVFAAEDLALVDSQEWYWANDTNIVSVAVGDVDGDGSVEIVTGGFYYDGTRNIAQLCVWDEATLALEDVEAWYWTDDTGIESVAIGDVDADGVVEIITGGWFWDGTRYLAQLVVWNGATLALEGNTAWYWTSDTVILSIDVGNVDGDEDIEIVTGGYFNDGTRNVAQLVVWNGATLALEGAMPWYWTSDTVIRSVAIGDTGLGVGTDIVTGGYFNDGTRNVAQLVVWNGATLALEGNTAWYWTSDTEICSVVVDDFDISAGMEIVTGGHYWDGTRFNSQVCVWIGSSLTLDYPAQHWYTGGWTKVYSVALGDWDSDTHREVITGGSQWDDSYGFVAEIWIGEFLEAYPGFKGWGVEAQESWLDSIYIASVATYGAKIYTGGAYYDGSRYVAHLGVWTAG